MAIFLNPIIVCSEILYGAIKWIYILKSTRNEAKPENLLNFDNL